MVNHLCIGTAQFGLDYGITNINGKVNEENVKKILEKANNSNVYFIDTAQAYADAEYVLGRNIPENSNFEIITKLNNKLFNSSEKDLLENLELSLISSLKKLKVKSINSLLIHNINNLKNSNYNLIYDWFESLKERKIVKRIGISIYSPEDLNNIEIEKFQLIQIPFSIYDQRFSKNNLIGELCKKGISIHLRSIFLQGLILQKSELWPNNLSDEFKLHHQSFLESIKNSGLNVLEEILKGPFLLDNVEAVLVGVTNFKEFNEILSFWLKLSRGNYSRDSTKFKDWAWNNIDDIDPRKWNSYKK